AGGVIGDRALHGIAGIAQIDEIDALDDAPVFDVETRNEAGFEHQAADFLLAGIASLFSRINTTACKRSGSRRVATSSPPDPLRLKRRSRIISTLPSPLVSARAPA